MNKNSNNSSKPPSSDGFKKKTKSLRTKSGKSPGGQKGHEGNTLELSDNPDEVVIHAVGKCETCGVSLENETPESYIIRQVIDIEEAKPKVTEHRAENTRCPKCGAMNKGKFPKDIINTVQYGERVKATAVYLTQYQLIPYKRSKELIDDLLGINLSEGTIANFNMYCYEATEPLEDNIKNVFLNPVSAIFEEPENLLKQEVREPAVYNAIITAVATGSSRMSEIATKIGETTSVCSQYMKNLINLGLIRKETPYGEKESRKSIYAIADNMFRFWYRFIPDNNSIISRGATELAYKRIAPNLSDYMGRIFEEICMQYLWKLLLDGKAPVEFSNLGRWWGTDPQERIQTEIDIMGDQDKSTALFGECKWINENVDVKVLEKLKKRSRLFRYENVHLFLFAKKGFTQGCIEEAGKMGNVSLVTYDQIYEYLNDRGITAF